jgi:hypothetical protein
VKILEADLLRMVIKGEGSHVELREHVPENDPLARTLCAYANTRGGWLVIGVDEDRKVVGCENPDEALTHIRLVAEEDIKPALEYEAHSVETKNGWLITVHVNQSSDRPHSIPCAKRKREILMRVGLTNEVAEGGTLNALRSHRIDSRPREALEGRILEWLVEREKEANDPPGTATPEDYSQAANVSVRRAGKALINLECGGLVIGAGDRYHRFYAMP